MAIQPGLKIVSDLEMSIMGKAVQLYIGEMPILALGGLTTDHGAILDQILEENGITDFVRVKLPGCREMHAEKKGRLYVAVGMGLVEMSKDQIELHHESGSYGLVPNEPHLVDVRPYIPEFKLSIG